MRETLKFLCTLAAAFLLMLCIRSLAFTIYHVRGNALAPLYISGDRVLVNRWSYGLRLGGDAILPYSRIGRSMPRRGDIVAFNMPGDSVDAVLIARCKALPGDTLPLTDGMVLVPGRKTCAKTDYYWLESLNKSNPVDSRHLGFIPEQCIIGRVVAVLFSHDDSCHLLEGYRNDRLLR